MPEPLVCELHSRQHQQSQRHFSRRIEADRYRPVSLINADSKLYPFTLPSANCRVNALAFDTKKQVTSAHKGGVTWLDLEPAENRYLLAGSADCSVAIYDVAQPTPPQHGRNQSGDCASVLKITSATPGCHQYSVSSVCWYPIDNGVFVTGSFDNQVKVLTLCCKLHATAANIHPQVANAFPAFRTAGLGCKLGAGSLQFHLCRQGVWSGNVISSRHTLFGGSGWCRSTCQAV